MHEFPHEDGIIHLNHAGVGTWPARTRDAVCRFAEENARRGSANYRDWLAVEQRLRERFARLLNAAGPEDIAFVKNTSEGLSLVAYGLDWQPGDEVVINNLEFPSNRIVWESLRDRFGVRIRDVDLQTAEDPEAELIAAFSERTRLLAISSVQYGTGLRMDLARLGAACERHDVLFCVDAIQTLGALRLDAHAIGADYVIADGHKWLLGPEGLGVFYSHPASRDQLKLFQYGWHMVQAAGDFDRTSWEPASDARRFEAGSPNMVAIHALEASLSLFEELGMDQVEARVLENSARLCELIQAQTALELITDPGPERRAGIVTFACPSADAGAVYRSLQAEGILCANRAGGIRFSPHFYNTEQQLETAVAAATKLAR